MPDQTVDSDGLIHEIIYEDDAGLLGDDDADGGNPLGEDDVEMKQQVRFFVNPTHLFSSFPTVLLAQRFSSYRKRGGGGALLGESSSRRDTTSQTNLRMPSLRHRVSLT